MCGFHSEPLGDGLAGGLVLSSSGIDRCRADAALLAHRRRRWLDRIECWPLRNGTGCDGPSGRGESLADRSLAEDRSAVKQSVRRRHRPEAERLREGHTTAPISSALPNTDSLESLGHARDGPVEIHALWKASEPVRKRGPPLRLLLAGGGGQGGFLVLEPSCQIAVGPWAKGRERGGAAAGGRFQREKNELIKICSLGLQAGTGPMRRSQRNPAPTHLD